MSSHSEHRSSKQLSHQGSRRYQQVAALYQLAIPQPEMQNQFRPYYGDDKYCCIFFEYWHAIEKYPFTPPGVRSVVRQRLENNTAKRPVKSRIPYKRRREPYFGQRPAVHYPTTSYQDCRTVYAGIVASSSASKIPQCQQR